MLVCYPPPNEAALGDPCDLHDGPFCQGGALCGPTAVCIPFCCETAECTGPGEECVPVLPSQGTLGGCIDPALVPDCASPGSSCRVDADCCSNDCHSGHCH